MKRYPEPTVGAIIFNPEGKILLCKSHKWENKYVIPGGHIELGEKMEDALKREIFEETGLNIYDIKLISLKESVYSDTFHEKKHFIFIDYLCKTDSSNVILNDEAEEFAWAYLNKIQEYDLGGFTRELLSELANKEGSNKNIEIFYNY
jgi:nucleoside triphosphatase